MHLYGLKTCDTCRKALKTLEQAGYAVTLVDVRADGVTPDQLAVFHGAFGTALVNTRSTTWRGLSEAARGQDPLTLLAAHPALMKRPVIERAGVLTLGWGKDVQAGFTT
ncbi:MAG: arsenate reductase [Rhodobacteraceae bacterium]|nr:arsenate reductase [Paracoccaceae bacterium]